ncbi:hypothetical protein [Roseateles oligotrophus]|uniref:5-bromo-4-chloroindolyl phosphate hydrolysis protein n=1 Tax=Roseateles oligotrophus TaxID=1769250 RepID=A0ABT2YG72_9BURK|nr:hypothetical protein [Roseateles oligotrophus]MCV2369052.1 hypothetical protein [Roseateles oligotrophus]
MSMLKLKSLNATPSNWDAHLKQSYLNCRGEHTSSWYSWAKTRLRSGNRGDTAVNSAGQVAGGAGLVTGAMALPGAATAATMAGMSVAAAATLYALPAVITVGAVAYWGYNKNEHHKVNKEIWEYWQAHRQRGDKDTCFELDDKKLVRWLGWFGDEGISNMNHMGPKNKEAKESYDKKVNAIDNARIALHKKILLVNALRPTLPKEIEKKATEVKALKQESDNLAAKYIDLGKDLQYITYRVERFVMYHEMLDLTVRSWKKISDLPTLQAAAATAFVDQLKTYQELHASMAALPTPA